MNGSLYHPKLSSILKPDEKKKHPHNTQNYNKYGYVMNNPLMYSDPSGELFFLIPLVGYFWSAVIVGAAIGAASYMISAAITGQQITLGGFLKSTFFGAVGGAATFGIGSIFSNTAGTITTLAQSIKDTVGGVGLAIVQAGTHAVSQGVLGLMQGQSFISGAAAGFLGSLGAAGWGEMVGSKFAGSAVGQITFGALSGGIGAEFTGGNFWQGAITGGIVAGLNHAMHSMGELDDNGYDENGKKINDLGGDKTDYILRKNAFGGDGYQVLESTDVKHIYGPYANSEGYGYRLHNQLPSPALTDPSFGIMSSSVGGAVVGRAFGAGVGYLSTSNKVGQLAFNSKYIGGTSKFFGRYKLGGHQGYLNRSTNWRMGWSWNNASKTHQFMIRTGGKWNSTHGNSWFNYKP
jgi:hypothetical protein